MGQTFGGFTDAEFDVFTIPGFPERMAEIRSRIRPRLLELAADLAGPIAAVADGEMFGHAAQHMRRRVNPPAETWAAFGRDRRGYKRWTHFRIAIRESGVRVTVFVEDDADDKPTLALSLECYGEPLLTALGGNTGLHCDGLEAVEGAALVRLGRDLGRLKGTKFQAGVALPRADVPGLGAAGLEAWVLDQVRRLSPLYAAATDPEWKP
ncbi:MAG: DUF1054 family protein [Armatimonadetes bacterium]|nr:DUF1054 family protein [Armatimonadota bacterium]